MARLMIVAIAAWLAACGPGRYIAQVGRASDALDEARAARAETFAPYWWTRATQYLHKAREVAAHADYQGANRYGRLATEAANQAADEARLAAKDPQRRPLDLPHDVAPARLPEEPAAPAKPIAPAKDAKPIAPAKDAP